MMTSQRPRVWIAGLALAVVWSGGSEVKALDDEPAASPLDAKKAAWLHETYLKDASEYEFFLDTPKREPLKLRRDPAMRWTSGGSYHGEVYVWTHDGAAAIVGCVFSGPQGDNARRIMHEFHSLASVPIVAGNRGASKWQPAAAGITFKPVPRASEPARTKVLRLAQMREIARDFTAQVDRQGGVSEMRLLPQPIYRYEIDEPGAIVDGAVFAFVWSAGTDPEALIVIEARRDGDTTAWHYAPARFTNREARINYRGKEIWKVEAETAGIFDGITNRPYGAFSIKTLAYPAETR